MISLPNKKVTAVVPALNEEATVGNVLKVLLGSKYLDEVILVDDGSIDKTAEIGEKLGAKVRRLNRIGGSGKGNAMQQGVEATNADIIIFFDADLIGLSEKHISLLVEPMLKENIDMCIGVRNRLLKLPGLLVKIDPLTAIGGERAIKRELFLRLPGKFLQGFMVETALDYYCLINVLNVRHVTLENLDVVIKEKKLGFVKGLVARFKMIFEVVKIRLMLKINKNEFIQKDGIR